MDAVDQCIDVICIPWAVDGYGNELYDALHKAKDKNIALLFAYSPDTSGRDPMLEQGFIGITGRWARNESNDKSNDIQPFCFPRDIKITVSSDDSLSITENAVATALAAGVAATILSCYSLLESIHINAHSTKQSTGVREAVSGFYFQLPRFRGFKLVAGAFRTISRRDQRSPMPVSRFFALQPHMSREPKLAEGIPYLVRLLRELECAN